MPRRLLSTLSALRSSLAATGCAGIPFDRVFPPFPPRRISSRIGSYVRRTLRSERSGCSRRRRRVGQSGSRRDESDSGSRCSGDASGTRGHAATRRVAATRRGLGVALRRVGQSGSRAGTGTRPRRDPCPQATPPISSASASCSPSPSPPAGPSRRKRRPRIPRPRSSGAFIPRRKGISVPGPWSSEDAGPWALELRRIIVTPVIGRRDAWKATVPTSTAARRFKRTPRYRRAASSYRAAFLTRPDGGHRRASLGD